MHLDNNDKKTSGTQNENKFQISNFIKPDTIMVPFCLAASLLTRSSICNNDTNAAIFFLGYSFGQILVSFLYEIIDKNILTSLLLISLGTSCMILQKTNNQDTINLILCIIGVLSSIGFTSPVAYHIHDKNSNNYLVPLAIGIIFNCAILLISGKFKINLDFHSNNFFYISVAIICVGVYYALIGAFYKKNKISTTDKPKNKTSDTTAIIKDVTSFRFISLMIISASMPFVGMTYVSSYLAPYIAKYINIETSYFAINAGFFISFLFQYILATYLSNTTSYIMSAIGLIISNYVTYRHLQLYAINAVVYDTIFVVLFSNILSLCVFNTADKAYQQNKTFIVCILNWALVIPIYIYPKIANITLMTKNIIINQLMYSSIISIIGMIGYMMWVKTTLPKNSINDDKNSETN